MMTPPPCHPTGRTAGARTAAHGHRLAPPLRAVQGFDYWWCWVEIKAPGGTLRETQRLLRDLWEPSGHWIEARTPEQAVADLQRLYEAALPQELKR